VKVANNERTKLVSWGGVMRGNKRTGTDNRVG